MILYEIYDGILMVEKGKSLYNVYCLVCYGKDCKGGNVYVIVFIFFGLKN